VRLTPERRRESVVRPGMSAVAASQSCRLTGSLVIATMFRSAPLRPGKCSSAKKAGESADARTMLRSPDGVVG
jgi:hypothetical protein